MKAAVFLEKGVIEVQELEKPTPKTNEVLVAVKACGICGTDQHIYHGQPGSAEVNPPIVLGHELAGQVVEVGENVTTFKQGDRVSIDPNIYCGVCEYCQDGRPHLCDNLEAVGVTRDGGMGEYVLAPQGNCYPLPDSLTYEEGAMIEPLGCVLHGIEQINIWPGSSVFIIGGGYIGQMMLQMAKMYGASPIIVSEPDEAKHQQLLELGADKVINPIKDNVQDQVGAGTDIVIECVGRQETMEQSVHIARKGGQVLLFGVSAPDTKISISPFEIFSKELTIKGSFINPHTHKKAISLVENGKVQIKPLLSHFFKIYEIPEVMARYHILKPVKGIIKF